MKSWQYDGDFPVPSFISSGAAALILATTSAGFVWGCVTAWRRRKLPSTFLLKCSPPRWPWRRTWKASTARWTSSIHCGGFHLRKKTDQELAKSRKPHERFALLWLAHFERLREELQKGIQRICNAPPIPACIMFAPNVCMVACRPNWTSVSPLRYRGSSR